MGDLAKVENENDDINAQLLILSDTTKKTGALHDGQIQQFKMWILLLTNATKFKFGFEFDSKLLIFDLLEFIGKPPTGQFKKFELIERWCRELLRDDNYKVIVKKKGSQIYPRVKVGRNSKSRTKAVKPKRHR